MKDELANTVKDSLRYAVDSFVGVLSFDVRPGISEGENVDRIVKQTSTVCTVIGCVNPIPLTDFIVLTPIHVKMCVHIAKVKGFELTTERAGDILGEVGGAVGLSVTAGALASFAKLIPVVGTLVYVPFVYGTTWAIGRAIEAYFDGEKSGRRLSASELKDVFTRELSRGKSAGALMSKAEIDQVYQEFKVRIDQREKVKSERQEDLARRGKDVPLPSAAASPVTPSRISIKEKPSRKPAGKTIGVEAAPAPEPEAAPAPSGKNDLGPAPRLVPLGEAAVEPLLVRPAKTIGPPAPEPSETVDLAAARHEISVTAKPSPGGGPASAPAATATPPSEAQAPKKPGLVDELERLAKLKELGALTQEEFEAAKKKLLAG